MLWSLQQDSDRQNVLCQFCQRLYPDDQYQVHWENCFDRKKIIFRRKGRLQQSKKSTISTTCDTTTTPYVTKEEEQYSIDEQKLSYNKSSQNQSSKSQPQTVRQIQPIPTKKTNTNSVTISQITQTNPELKQDCEKTEANSLVITIQNKVGAETQKKPTIFTNCDTIKTAYLPEKDKQTQKQNYKYEYNSSYNRLPQNQLSKSQPPIKTKTQTKNIRKESSSQESSLEIGQKNLQLREREQDQEDDMLCRNCQTHVKYSLFGAHELRCYRQVECDDCSNLFPMHLIGSHMQQCPERVRKKSEASSLANQRAVIGGSSSANKRWRNGHLQGLMDMITGMRGSGSQNDALLQELQSNAIIEFFTPRDKGFTDVKILNQIVQLMRFQEKAPQEELCCFCLELLNDKIRTKLPCKHIHHEDCIKPWLIKERNCPICKGTVNTNEEKHNKDDILSVSEQTEETDAASQKTQETRDH